MLKNRSLRASTTLCALIAGLVGNGQSSDQWYGGYDSDSPYPYGGNSTLFNANETAVSDTVDRAMWVSSTVTMATGPQEAIIAYTNGIYIANTIDEPMDNGTGLNPSFYTSDVEIFGLRLPSSHHLLRIPESESLLALFHLTVDTTDQNGTFVASHLYHSLIDLTQDGGNGAVILKNHVLLDGVFSRSGVASVRHANGRDWWVFFHENLSNVFIRFLLTPSGVSGPWYQPIGSVRLGGSPVISFTMAGDKALMIDAFADLDIFDFDRCTGELVNWRHADIDDGEIFRYAAFSPSGRFAYVTSVTRIYQYDLLASDLETSMDTVAEWDGSYDSFPQFSNVFVEASLAADGKIYISTGNSTRYLHIIEQPDSLGLACNVVQHEHNRITFTDNSICYPPNYALGPVDGSICDSLGINAGLPERSSPLRLSAYPNPNRGTFTLNYEPQAEPGMLEIREVSGKLLLQEGIPPWSSVHVAILSDIAPGLFDARIHWRRSTGSVRIMIQP